MAWRWTKSAPGRRPMHPLLKHSRFNSAAPAPIPIAFGFCTNCTKHSPTRSSNPSTPPAPPVPPGERMPRSGLSLSGIRTNELRELTKDLVGSADGIQNQADQIRRQVSLVQQHSLQQLPALFDTFAWRKQCESFAHPAD